MASEQTLMKLVALGIIRIEHEAAVVLSGMLFDEKFSDVFSTLNSRALHASSNRKDYDRIMSMLMSFPRG